MKLSRIIGLLGLVALAGCSSYDINYDYDMDTNFNAFQTYTWMEREISDASGSAKTALQSNTLLDQRIREAVDAQLQREGLTIATDPASADVMMVYHTGAQNKIDVTDWGYTYAGSYWGGGLGRSVDVYSYTEGTLIVDMVSTANKKLVWRGSATGVVDPSASPEERQARINDVVSRIFANYPPGK